MPSLLDRLESSLLTGDGAMGTYLYAQGAPLDKPFELLNLTDPDRIASVHRHYLEAGARLIETNSFRANALVLEPFGRSSDTTSINARAAQIARREATPFDACVAGSVGPLALKPYDPLREQPDVIRNFYRESIQGLLEGGVDALILETFTSVEEILLVLETARSMTSLPIISSLSCGEAGTFPGGQTLQEAFKLLKSRGATLAGVNCTSGPRVTRHLFSNLTVGEDDRLCAFPNAGHPEYHEGRYFYFATPDYFAEMATTLVRQGVRLIGGCCGTTPAHIKAMADTLQHLAPVRTSVSLATSARTETPAPSTAVEPPREETILDIQRKRTLIVTELDPPKTLVVDKFIQGSRALKEAGSDAVTLADNSLAVLRISNMAMSVLIKEKAGVLPLVHIACRDKNLLGLQSELLGLSALGINHILAITGDPAKVGDHPGATSVYDVNSVGLIEMMKRMNESLSHSGKSIKHPTRFVIGAAFNPNSRNLDSQVKKLERKIQAGAHYVMTQPVFDRALIRETFAKTRSLGIPVLAGIMPLMNARNTEFLHNEVPGISIPDSIRERMRGREGEDGVREGLAIARELAEEVLSSSRGIYLITPILRYDITVQLSRWIREQSKKS